MKFLKHKAEYKRMRREASQALRSTGLTVEAFLSLSEMDGTSKMADIAAKVCLDGPSLSRVRGFLVENNFAKPVKNRHDSDPRTVYMKATPKGLRILNKYKNEIFTILGGKNG